jgi:hypothetical protein
MGEGAAKIYEVGEGQISRAGRLLWTSVRIYFYISSYNAYHRGEKGIEEKKGGVFCPLSWIVHYNFAGDGYIESTMLLCQSKIFRHGNKNTLSLVMVNSAM